MIYAPQSGTRWHFRKKVIFWVKVRPGALLALPWPSPGSALALGARQSFPAWEQTAPAGDGG